MNLNYRIKKTRRQEDEKTRRQEDTYLDGISQTAVRQEQKESSQNL